jgi:hypothetical protein
MRILSQKDLKIRLRYRVLAIIAAIFVMVGVLMPYACMANAELVPLTSNTPVSQRSAIPAFSASPTSGPVPLEVAFTISSANGPSCEVLFGEAGPVHVTFNDCKDAGGECVTHISHIYSREAAYTPLLICGTTAVGSVRITAGGAQSQPVLKSISPSEGKTGTKITLSGSGVLAKECWIIIDNRLRVPPSYVDRDSFVTFDLPRGAVDKDFLCPRSTAPNTVVTCNPVALPIGEGKHSIAVQTSNGVSNALSFVVVP